MTQRKIVIVFTGTVASTLAPKIINTFKKDDYKVSAVFTERAKYFLSKGEMFSLQMSTPVYSDTSEWHGESYHKDQKIPHIELAKENDLLLIIASADYMAKMANGFCDDLASSLYRAWDRTKPVFLCPAMNTQMWEHPVTKTQLVTLNFWGVNVIFPIVKKLACGDEGMGALEDISKIKERIDKQFENVFPLSNFNGIPVKNHQGAFLAKRKYAPHTGVDLYTSNGEYVQAMNDGVVVSIEDFTGKGDNSPWWNDTKCVLIKHWFGVVCYGEIDVGLLFEGEKVTKGQTIGTVKQVLKKGKERPDIAGHSLSMLHIELYPENVKRASKSYEQDKDILLDPTDILKRACGGNVKLLE